jgi:glutamate-1-semialdehyde 2,1-aminomutase
MLSNGTSFGAPTEVENKLASLITMALPSIQMLRFVSSGTEATMSAMRLARAYTGRDKILKFEGAYHGHVDGLLVAAGSGAASHSVPNSAGVDSDSAGKTLVAQYNDIESVKTHFERHPNEIACVMVEPVSGNMGVIPPEKGFLEELRSITSQNNTLLLFDEIITGFRVAYGGAQTLYSIEPDLTCLGKIIGGGMPVGAYGGKKEIMKQVSPLGPMYQAGTLSGNPITMAAGLKTLEILSDSQVYRHLETVSSALELGLTDVMAKAKVPVTINRVGSMMTVFFSDKKVMDWKSVSQCNQNQFENFFIGMLKAGVYIPPSPFEAMFLSTEHSTSDIEKTIRSAKAIFN